MKNFGGCVAGALFLMIGFLLVVAMLGSFVAAGIDQATGACDPNRPIHVENGLLSYDTDECYYNNRPSVIFGGQ